MVGEGHPEDRPSAVDPLLPGRASGPPADGARLGRRAAGCVWYHKKHPTFTDALALVRNELWAQEEATFHGTSRENDTVKVSREFVEGLTEAVCYAA